MAYLLDKLKQNSESIPYKAPLPKAHEQAPYGYSKSNRPECLIEVPDIRQPDDYSCGACCAMSVGKYYGVGPNTLKEWKAALGTTKEKSTEPEKIEEFLKSLGVQCVCKQGMTLCDLREYHELGIPVICCIQEYMQDEADVKEQQYGYGHYVTVIGTGFKYVFVSDPSIDNIMEKEGADNAKGRMMIDEDTFDENWVDEDLYDNEYNHYGIACFAPNRGK